MTSFAAVSGWWALARASGLAAWLFVVVSLVLGALAAGRMVPARGATRWLLDLHPWISTIGLALVGLHGVALLADTYIGFDLVDLLVPFAAPWRTLAVAWGVVAFWGLVTVESTSLVRRWMPKAPWHKVHLVSYGVAVLVTVHALTAGSDVTALPVRVVLVGSVFGALVVSGLRARQAAIAAGARANQTGGQPVPASTGAIGSWSVPARPPVVVPSRAPSSAEALGAPRPDGPPTASPKVPPAPYGVDR